MVIGPLDFNVFWYFECIPERLNDYSLEPIVQGDNIFVTHSFRESKFGNARENNPNDVTFRV
jgi:hypothetical protein